MMESLMLILTLLLLNIDETKPAESNAGCYKRFSSNQDESRFAPIVLIVDQKEYEGSFTKFCHGTLVHSRMVLTNAGYFTNKEFDNKQYEVFYTPNGETDRSLESGGFVKEIFHYEETSRPPAIVLLRIPKINIRKEFIPRLPDATEQLAVNDKVLIVGYGGEQTKRRVSMHQLKDFAETFSVKMTVLSDRICAKNLANFDANTMTCLAPKPAALGRSLIGRSDVGLGLLVDSATNLTEETSLLCSKTHKPPLYTIHAVIANSFNYGHGRGLKIHYPIYLTKVAGYSYWIESMIETYAKKPKMSFLCG